jgi:hypothetical protein
MAGISNVTIIDGVGNLKTAIVAVDANNNIAPAHTLVDANGISITVAQDATVNSVVTGLVSVNTTANAIVTGLVSVNTTVNSVTTGLVSVNTSVNAVSTAINNKIFYLSPTLSTPQSTLTRPSNTTAYAGTFATPQLIASNTTNTSIAVSSFSILTSGGYAGIPRCNLTTNVTTGWGSVFVVVTIFTAAPTYTNGDGGTYAVATGSSKVRAQYSGSFTQQGDGAFCNMVPIVGSIPVIHPDSGALLYWDIQIQSSATPISGQTFTLTPEIWN